MLARLAALLLPLFALGCAPRGAPLAWHHGTPWAQAEVNGVPGIFLVDTGASMSVLDSRFAARARVPPAGTHRVIGTTGSLEAPMGTARSVEFDGYEFRGVPVSIQDLGGFAAPAGTAQDGILGNDLFAGGVLRFDILRGRIHLHSEPDGEYLPPFPLELRQGLPMVELQFPGEARPRLAKLDSGSGFLDGDYVHIEVGPLLGEVLLGARRKETLVRSTQVRSLAGVETLDIHRLGSVRFLGTTFEEVRLVVHTKAAGIFESPDAIIIAANALRAFDVVEIDYDKRCIRIRPAD